MSRRGFEGLDGIGLGIKERPSECGKFVHVIRSQLKIAYSLEIWHLAAASCTCEGQHQGSTAPSKPPGAEPFAPAGRRPAGGCPRDFGHLSNFGGGAAPSKFLLSGGSPLTFDSYPSSPGGQLHRSSSGCGLPQAVMAGRKSLLSFGFSSNRAQQVAELPATLVLQVARKISSEAA